MILPESRLCYTVLTMDWINQLMQWYRANARDLPWRRTRDAYAIWVSEIMLQQTRVAAVVPYYERFLAELPDVCALAAVNDDRLHKLWEGLGYYSRARNLKRAAAIVAGTYGGKLPECYEELLKLPGVGEYTAGAIASIAFGEPVPSVDGNVLRVYARLFAVEKDVRAPSFRRQVRGDLLTRMPKDEPGLFNAALMELGAIVCVPNGAPDCEACPVKSLCEAYKQGRTGELPAVSKKRARRVVQKTVFALSCSGRPLGYRRPETGLLAGLWQLPEADGTLSDRQASEWLGEHNLRPLGELRFYERKHVFTHVEWHMRVCAAEVAADEPPEGWVLLDESHALPTAYKVCL